jgi:hypothetical protein
MKLSDRSTRLIPDPGIRSTSRRTAPSALPTRFLRWCGAGALGLCLSSCALPERLADVFHSIRSGSEPAGSSFRVPRSGLAMYHYPALGVWESTERGYAYQPDYTPDQFGKDITAVLVADGRIPATHQVRVLQDGRLRAEPNSWAGAPAGSVAGAQRAPFGSDRVQQIPTFAAGSPVALPESLQQTTTYQPAVTPRQNWSPPVAPSNARIIRDRRGVVYVRDRATGVWESRRGAYKFVEGGNPFVFSSQLTSELRADGKIPAGHRAQLLPDGRIRIVPASDGVAATW